MRPSDSKNPSLTYVSLFSSAGVGCYGFHMEGFECIATNELISRRLDIQKANGKCRHDSGYICGDITKEETQQRILDQVTLWEATEHTKGVDVVIATPPCQGMSVANLKKRKNEIVRNSLVIESIKMVERIRPRIFLFENVPAFMRTACTDTDGSVKSIGEAISGHLGKDYSIASRVINFKNYGANSSRTRTLVIGVANQYADEISPYELYPEFTEEKTLRDVIGDLPSLDGMGEISEDDIYHAFRRYPEHMRAWIHDLAEGECAFDQADDLKKPHKVVDGQIVIHTQKNADKYTRQCWDKVGPCVHTRNDQMASQNTVHPTDDRVFSIRELMRMMSIPDEFRWTDDSLDTLNALSHDEKAQYLKKYEMVIRQSLGEAVPTEVFRRIAANIRQALGHNILSAAAIRRIINQRQFDTDSLVSYIEENPDNLSVAALGRIAELANANRVGTAAFFTNKALVTKVLSEVPIPQQETIRILEPSVGVGNFVFTTIRKFDDKKIQFDVCDIDESSLRIMKALVKRSNLPKRVTINYVNDDFLTHDFVTPDSNEVQYDLVIGNPPFYKMGGSDKELLGQYRAMPWNHNRETSNICSFFLDKGMHLGKYVALVFPKFLLNTPEFSASREYISSYPVDAIIDFGEHGFSGVLIETIAILVNSSSRRIPKRHSCHVVSIEQGLDLLQSQPYIFSPDLPYWVIYRNDTYDRMLEQMDFDVFTVFRDRQISNSSVRLSDNQDYGSAGIRPGEIRLLKSRNIAEDGSGIVDIPGYDAYVREDFARGTSGWDVCHRTDAVLVPNMTYKPRAIRNPGDCVCNGSVAVLLPKDGIEPTDEQLRFFASDEYRTFYRVARNYQTRSLNIDAKSVYLFGLVNR